MPNTTQRGLCARIMAVLLLVALIIIPGNAQAADSQKLLEKKSANWWYSDKDGYIAIRKVRYASTWCYIAHLKFKNYKRFMAICSNNKYGGRKETTLAAARRTGAIFAVNGDYSAKYLKYTTARSGKVVRRGKLYAEAIYSRWDGILCSPAAKEIYGMGISRVVKKKLASDTFQFGPAFNLKKIPKSTGARAQRTFMGTNGNPGDIYIVVTNGRRNDGVSLGLTGSECARLLKKLGCTFGIPLDGGGSSTMVFKGRILNSAENRNGRAVVDHIVYVR